MEQQPEQKVQEHDEEREENPEENLKKENSEIATENKTQAQAQVQVQVQAQVEENAKKKEDSGIEMKVQSEEDSKKEDSEMTKEEKLEENIKKEDSEMTKEEKLEENIKTANSGMIKEEEPEEIVKITSSGTNFSKGPREVRRRKSFYDGFDAKQTFFRPEFQNSQTKDLSVNLWELMDVYLPRDVRSIQKSIVNHIEYTLARTRFDLDEQFIFQGTALSVRDRLLEAWNDTMLYIKKKNPKRVYYLSIEFLLGRLLQNALVNMNLESCYRDALMEWGFKLEDVYERENDAALGNGGLGRLAACYMESLSTLNYPAWGYGIRYDYGIFKQVIENYQQKELPDYWLTKGNPWEVMRLDVKYKVRFGGYVKEIERNGRKVRVWEGGDEVDAVAFDTAIPGFGTFNCNTLRLWKSFPSEEFDFESFNKGDYQSALEDKDQASCITSVLYPNDTTPAGKELRLKQEYFFSCATIQDIVRRFKQTKLAWSEFPKHNAIQLNDTHPTVAITELLRILIDINDIDYREAFNIVSKTFNYTNHTVLPEALEKWPVDVFGRLLPRHLELIYLINYYFMEDVKKRYPNNMDKLSRLSLIEESYPKQIRMANLCIVSSNKVNGVAEIHSNLLKTHLFKDFYEYWPQKFTNVTNGVTPRRWIHCAFPELSDLLTEYYGEKDWLAELELIADLPESLKNEGKEDEFIEKYKTAKLKAKLRLKEWVKKNTGHDIHESFLFDVMVKRIHEYKRQFMNALYCIYRYFLIKNTQPQNRHKFVKRVTFFGGKAAPGYAMAKNIIKLINMIAQVVNNDKDVNDYFKIIFLPDYKVSAAQIIIPAADISQHISTAGTEASGTSCMKFAMTGSLILGTRDGANIEIAREIGEENIFFFGNDVKGVERIRNEMKTKKWDYAGQLHEVFEAIQNKTFGDTTFMSEYISMLINGGDFYLVCHDFGAYIKAQENVDESYADTENWTKRCITSITRMGNFSSDRAIITYAREIWGAEPMEVPMPSLDKGSHFVSQENLIEAEDSAGHKKMKASNK